MEKSPKAIFDPRQAIGGSLAGNILLVGRECLRYRLLTPPALEGVVMAAHHQSQAGSANRLLPVGTVTFMFTDIEGSTELVARLGPAQWTPLLERHRTILRRAIAAGGGTEVQTEGDGFFAVFERAPAAVAAVAAAQRALAAEPWPADATIKVRMGLHTGEGTLDADGAYVGTDVHRAARISAAAHGGQVLLSDSVRALVSGALPPGVELMNLGEHRLKDLRPERLAQIRIDGLPCAFPPIRSLDARPNNLPTQLTSFIGREHELAEAASFLSRTRLLTLSGPGGTGKTRLSLQLAATASEDFPDGIWFVALEAIHDPALVGDSIARALSLALSSSRPAVEIVAESIGAGRVLLILDNFEQIVAAAPTVSTLLRACAELRVVVTSRAPLHVSGEQEYEVPGLPAPPDISRMSLIERENLPAALRSPAVETLNQYEAVRLFIARARAVLPDFAVTNDNAPAVAQICARLHGMPLAIELAAAWVKLLTPAQVLVRLEHQLDLLVAGARDLPRRQQTLRGAIAWSYELLDEPTRRLLNRLSVFTGGWDLAAAEAVCGSDDAGLNVLGTISTLVDHSLVRRQEEDGEIRFEMFPTIQEFAAERLAEQGEAEVLAERHAAYFLALAEEAAAQHAGADQRVWLDRLERGHDNIRAVLTRTTERPDPETAARLGFAMWRFWQKRGYLDEGRRRLEAMEARGWSLSDPLRARLLEALGGIAYWQADFDAAAPWYDAAIAVWRRVGDQGEIANALYNRAFVEILPASREHWAGEAGREAERKIMPLLDEAGELFRKLKNRDGEGNVLWAIGAVHYFLRRPMEAERLYKQALTAFRAANDQTMEAWAEHMLALALYDLQRLSEARDIAQQALQRFHHAGDLAGIAMTLADFSLIAAAAGDHPRAGRLYGAAHELERSIGMGLVSNEDHYGPTRETLSPEDLDLYGAEGAAMSLDDVVAYALEG